MKKQQRMVDSNGIQCRAYIKIQDIFTVNGLTDRQIAKYQKNFWSVLNDQNKISKNIL